MTSKFDPTPHMIKLQGKDYLPVAARIAWMRGEHPDWSIITEPVTIGQALYMRATVTSGEGMILATAHKAATGRKGTAAQYPVEAGETGAIGRALGMCGYGTLSGDLDEGEEIADSPQASTLAAPRPTNGTAKPAGKAPTSGPTAEEVKNAILIDIEQAQTPADLDRVAAYANGQRGMLDADQKAAIRDALAGARIVIASMIPATGTV